MSLRPVFRFFAFVLFAVGAATIVPFIVAVALGEPGPQSFAAGAGLTAFTGACFYVLSHSLPRVRAARSGFRELILALVLFWAAVPLFAAIPFFSRAFSPPDAWFESVSALTTTGAWLSEPQSRATVSGLLYRASLQWLGGLASLATAAAIFVRPEFVGVQPPTPPFARGKEDSYLRAFGSAVRSFAPVYGQITLVSFTAFLLVGVRADEAAAMALSFIATGGLVPTPGGIATYGAAAVAVGVVTMIAGAVNFVVIARLALQGRGHLERGIDPETRAFLLLIIPIGLLYWVSVGAGDWDLIPAQLANAVSLLSTSGFVLGAAPQLTPLLVTAVIGGAAVSTAGGIKLLRWLITFQRAGTELWQLSHPGGVSGTKRPALHEFGVWIHTIAFTIVLATFVLIVAFFGYELELAAATAVAMVTNAGPLLAAVEGSTADYVQFAEPLRMLLALGMIAGRLELVLLLLLIDRNFWRG